MSSTLKICRHNPRRHSQNRKALHLKHEKFYPTKRGHLSMTLNLLLAATMGVLIPFMMTRFGRDPAVGSSVLITAVTDSGGFFIFLGLATIFLICIMKWVKSGRSFWRISLLRWSPGSCWLFWPACY